MVKTQNRPDFITNLKKSVGDNPNGSTSSRAISHPSFGLSPTLFLSLVSRFGQLHQTTVSVHTQASEASRARGGRVSRKLARLGVGGMLNRVAFRILEYSSDHQRVHVNEACTD